MSRPNFQPLEVVDRDSETQFEVAEKLNYYVFPSIEVGDMLLYFSPLISCHISFLSVRSLHAGGQTQDVDSMSAIVGSPSMTLSQH